MMTFQIPLTERWIVDGHETADRPPQDALYIKPLLNPAMLEGRGQVVHSLVLDNNVFSDLIGSRRPANNAYLERLARAAPIELNPSIALMEQRLKYGGATQALKDYCAYLLRVLNRDISDLNLQSLEALLQQQRSSLLRGMEVLGGYLPLTVYLYQQDWPIEDKVRTLAGLIKTYELPVFQLHFLFAALVFLVQEFPGDFFSEDSRKVKADMKVASTVDEQRGRVQNLASDLLLPALALFPIGLPPGTLVYPYAVTRDRLCQLLLSQVRSDTVEYLHEGRANGLWVLAPGSILERRLGPLLAECMPQSARPPSPDEIAVAGSRLRLLSEQYLARAVAERRGESS